MIVSPRSLMRANADARLSAEVLAWINLHPRHEWHTISSAEPHVPLNGEQLMRLWNQWVFEGWMEHKTDSGRSMWRATHDLPTVRKSSTDERIALSRYFSALLDLPVR